MNIYFVTSYGSIYNRVLPLIKEKGGDTIVVCTSLPIYRFFSEFTPYKTIYTRVNQNLITKRTWYMLIPNLIKQKSEYKQLFSNIKNANIYFFGIGWKIVTYMHIARLSKHNKVYLYPETQSSTLGKIENTPKTKLMSFLIKLLTGLDMVVYTDCGKLSMNISDKYLNKHNITVIHKEFNKDNIDITIPIDKDKYILVVTEDQVEYNRVTLSEMVKKMCSLDAILCSCHPGRYVIKPHPNTPKLYTNFHGKIISPYIPSEFLLKHPWKLIIGTESLTLINATKYTNAKVVSLLKFIKYKDPSVSQEFIDWMNKHTDKILFPENEKELEEVIKSVS